MWAVNFDTSLMTIKEKNIYANTSTNKLRLICFSGNQSNLWSYLSFIFNKLIVWSNIYNKVYVHTTLFKSFRCLEHEHLGNKFVMFVSVYNTNYVSTLSILSWSAKTKLYQIPSKLGGATRHLMVRYQLVNGALFVKWEIVENAGTYRKCSKQFLRK